MELDLGRAVSATIIVGKLVWAELSINAALRAPVCGSRCTARTHQLQLVLVYIVHARLMADQLDPILCLSLASGLKVVVPRGREESKDMLVSAAGIALAGNGSEIDEVDLVA